MKWTAVIAAFVLGAVAAFLMWLGWNAIDDIGLTSRSAVAFTLGGMLGMGGGFLCARLFRRPADRGSVVPDRTDKSAVDPGRDEP